MSKLILVGSVHNDNKGQNRLRKILEHYKPKIVCLESTLDNYAKGVRSHLDLKKELETIPFHKVFNNEELKRQEAIFQSSYFEQWVPYSYKNGSPNIRIICIDKDVEQLSHDFVDNVGREWLAKQLSSGKSLQEFLTSIDVEIMDLVKDRKKFESHQEFVDKLYSNYSHKELLEQFGQYIFDRVVKDRDVNFASKIRTIRERNPQDNILALLGNSHIFGDYGANTYDLLSELNPERIRLVEADSF